jgi:hypothetical protein
MSKRPPEVQSPAAKELKREANNYLENAIAIGKVTLSKINWESRLDPPRFIGTTAVTTDSGVTIERSSTGDLVVSSQLQAKDGSNPLVTASVLESTPAVVTEQNHNGLPFHMGGVALTKLTGGRKMNMLRQRIVEG